MRTCLSIFGFLSLLIYGGIAWLSHSFVYGQGYAQRPILAFLALYAGAFVLYAYVLGFAMPYVKREQNLSLILFFAVLFRVALLFSNPIQEDDFYRYLWDGQVTASGLNPYGIAPTTIQKRQEGSEDYARIITANPVFAEILARVNHPHVPTIYPPLAQGIFGATALVAPGSLLGLRLVFFAFDLGVCVLIVDLLRRLGGNAAWMLVYAWSPLVIKETINSAHYDVVPTFFLTLAFAYVMRDRWSLAHVCLALAILGKLYPALLVPLFFWKTVVSAGWRNALSGINILCAVLLLGYAPFLSAGLGIWSGTVAFAEAWRTNSFLFPFLQMLGGNRWVANGVVVVICGGLLGALLYKKDLRDARAFIWSCFIMLGALFALSPVGDPWYFVWLMPFLCLSPLRSWMLLSGLLGLYYLSFYFMYRKMADAFQWVLWLEYLPFYGMLLYEWRTGWSRHEPASPTESSVRFTL